MAFNSSEIHLKLIHVHLDRFYEYAKFFEHTLNEEQEQISEKYEKALTKIDPNEEYYSIVEESYIEDYQMIAETFTGNFRLFLLTQIYSTVEFELVKLHNRIHKLQRPNQNLPKLRADILGKVKTFFDDNSHVDFDLFKNEWDFLLKMRRLRNAIIHHDSKVKINENDLLDNDLKILSESGNLFKLLPDNLKEKNLKITIQSIDLNILFLDTMKSLFNKLLNQLI